MTIPAPDPKKPKKPKVDTNSYFGANTSAGKVDTASTYGLVKAKKEEKSPWNNIVSFGGSIIDAMSTPLYWLAGYNAAENENEAARLAAISKKYPTPKNETALERQKRELAISKDKELTQFKGPVDSFGAAGENATNWMRGKKSETFDSLAANILLDPITYVPGGVFIKPLKSVLTGARTTVKATKLAAAGQVSARIAFSAAGKKAAAEAAKSSAKKRNAAVYRAQKQTVVESTPFKPGESILNQFTNKPIIRGNLKTVAGESADRLNKVSRNIYNNFQYRTSPISPFENDAYKVIASGLEAGYKAAASTFLQTYAKASVETTLRIQAKAAERLTTGSIRAVDQMGQDLTLEPFVPHVLDDGTVLVKDKAGDTWKFGSEKTANKFIKKETDLKPAAKTTGYADILDVAPGVPSAAVVKTLTPKTPVAKSAKEILDTMNKLAATATGTSSAKDVVPRITDILNRIDAGRLSPTSVAAIKQATEEGGNPLDLIRTLVSRGSTADEKSLGRLLAKRTITTKTGEKIQIGEIAIRAAQPNGRKWNDLLPSTKEQILAELRGLTGGSTGSVKGKMDALTEIVGPEIAAQIAKTGALNPDARVDEAALSKIFNSLPSEVQKTYADFQDLLNGLKAGDTGIDLGLIEKLVKTIDPEAKAVKEIEKAVGKSTAYQQLAGILVSKGQQTLDETMLRVQRADAATFMQGSGLGNADAIAVTLEARLNGTPIETPAAAAVSRQAAGARVRTYMAGSDTSSVVKDAADAINKGMGGQVDYINKFAAEGPVVNRMTTLQDSAIVLEAGGKAAITSELTQYVDARIAANAVGKARYRASFNKVGNKTEKVIPTQKDILNRLMGMMEVADDLLLAVMGTRIVAKKTAIDAADTGNHFVYTSSSAFLQVLNRTDLGRDLIYRSIIPNTAIPGMKQTDALDFVSITNAIRRILEAEEKGTTLNVADIVSILRKKGASEEEWSPVFRKQVDKIANELAIYLVDPAVVKQFRDIHLARGIAAVDESATTANRLSEDLFFTFEQGHKANIDNGIDSTAARAQLARDWFQQFVYLSGALEQVDSETTKAVFQASALMFLSGGRIKATAGEGVTAPALAGSEKAAKDEDRAVWGEITDAINGMFKHQNADATPRMTPAREYFPTPEKIAKVTDNLTQAKLVFEGHVAKRAEATTTAKLEAWRKTHERNLAKMVKAREAAEALNIPTFYWHNGEWVPRARYNHDLAVIAAKENPDNLILTADGTVRAAITDVPPKPVAGKKLGVAETAKYIADWTEQNAQRSVTAMKGVHEENAQFALQNIDELDKLGVDDTTKGVRLFQELYARTYADDQIRVMSGRTTYEWERGPLGVNEYRPGIFQRAGEASNANTGRVDTRPVLNLAESHVHADVANLTDALRGIRNKYLSNARLRKEYQLSERVGRGLKPNERALSESQFQQAFDIALSGAKPRASTNKYVAELAADLRSILDPIFGTSQTSELVKAGVTPKAFGQALRRHGLTEELGFQSPTSEVDPLDLANYAAWLPFAKMPSGYKGTQLENLWKDRAKKFKDSGEDPFVMIVRLAHAVQFAKTEKTFVTDFVTRFSHEARNMTAAQAIRNNFVRIEGIAMATGTDLSQYIPKETYFPADVAKEFLSLNREWNKIFNDPKAQSEVTRVIMDIMGAFKTSQTVATLRHHVTNAVGDTTTAIIAGTTNPYHWGVGFALAAKYIGKDLSATFGADKVQKKIMRATEGITNPSRSIEVADEYGVKNPGIAIVNKNGRNTEVPISAAEWGRLFEERNILTSGIIQNDTPGLIDSVLNEKALKGAQLNAYDKASALLRKGSAAVARPLGTAASYYGNAIRAAHAMQVIQSRAWSSIDEALDAANEAINRYHPTIQSLAANERKYPRMVFSYYTWLRVAHNAFIDMLLNHTGAMLIPSKIQYSQAQEAGFDPESLGSPWEDREGYLKGQSYSVYGPTENGKQGPALYKRSILPLDVLDTWSFVNDDALTAEQNSIYNSQQFLRTLIKSSNQVLQPLGEFALKQNLDTGAPEEIKSWAELGDKYVQNWGPTALFRGLGADWAVPYNRRPENTKKPITQAERDLTLFNQLTGQKKQVLKSPRIIPVIEREIRARIKQRKENVAKENAEKRKK